MIKTSDLTLGERLVVRRRRDGMNQTQAAEALEVTRHTYQAWEADQKVLEGLDRYDARRNQPPRAPLGRLTIGEQAFVLRRRAGLTLAQVGEAIGCSAYWVRLMETDRAPTDRLAGHWGIAS